MGIIIWGGAFRVTMVKLLSRSKTEESSRNCEARSPRPFSFLSGAHRPASLRSRSSVGRAYCQWHVEIGTSWLFWLHDETNGNEVK